MAALDGFNTLQYLSLLSKVCAELESHTGAADKVLAEFIIHLARSSDNLHHFVTKLKDNGAHFPDYLVRTLFTLVHAVLIPAKTESKTREEGSGSSSWKPLKKRISSPEKGEAKQFTAAGNLSSPDDEEEGDGLLHQEKGDDEDIEIELNDDAPAFLQGKTKQSMDMSPLKIFKNPEGSLLRSAALQSALAKERREVREELHRSMFDSIPKDLNRPWEDPMPEKGERHLAYELRGVGLSAFDMPEWKENCGKTISFGPKSKLSIPEQRQSLPIYKLKNELIQAVHDNQVLVVMWCSIIP